MHSKIYHRAKDVHFVQGLGPVRAGRHALQKRVGDGAGPDGRVATQDRVIAGEIDPSRSCRKHHVLVFACVHAFQFERARVLRIERARAFQIGRAS